MTTSVAAGAIEIGETGAVQAIVEADDREARLVLTTLRRRKGPKGRLRQVRAVAIPVERIPAFVRLVDDAIGLAHRLDLIPKTGEPR